MARAVRSPPPTRATLAAATRPAPHLSRACCGAQTSGAAWARASRRLHPVFLTRSARAVERQGGGGDGTEGGAAAAEAKGGAEGAVAAEVEGEAELYLLQLVPTDLVWRSRGCVERLEADSPEDLPAGSPLRVRLPCGLTARGAARRRARVFLRVPGWAVLRRSRCGRWRASGVAAAAASLPPRARLGAGDVLALRLRRAGLRPARSDGGGGSGGGGGGGGGDGGDDAPRAAVRPCCSQPLDGERRFFAPPGAAAQPAGRHGCTRCLAGAAPAALRLDPAGVAGAAGGAAAGGAAGGAARSGCSRTAARARRRSWSRPRGRRPRREARGLRRRQRGHVARRTQPPPGEATGGAARAGRRRAGRVDGPVVFEAFDQPATCSLPATERPALLVGGAEHPLMRAAAEQTGRSAGGCG